MNSVTYTAVLLLHIVALAAAFGPVIAYAVVLRQAKATEGLVAADLVKAAGLINKRVAFPALVVTILLGFLLVALSQAYSFDQSWISASITVALLLAALSYLMLTPALDRLGAAYVEGEPAKALTAVRISTGLYQVGFLVIVWLMLAKPGM